MMDLRLLREHKRVLENRMRHESFSNCCDGGFVMELLDELIALKEAALPKREPDWLVGDLTRRVAGHLFRAEDAEALCELIRARARL